MNKPLTQTLGESRIAQRLPFDFAIAFEFTESSLRHHGTPMCSSASRRW